MAPPSWGINIRGRPVRANRPRIQEKRKSVITRLATFVFGSKRVVRRGWESVREKDAPRCARCRISRKYVAEHITKITSEYASCPLCVSCWAILSPEDRLPYYEAVFEKRWMERNLIALRTSDMDPIGYTASDLRGVVLRET